MIRNLKKKTINNSFYYPKVSVITVVKNGQKYLDKTIKSVINQKYKNIEYILVDANSSDNTSNIIKKYNQFIDIYIRKFDNSLWEAMNIGIKNSTGTIVCFINSDDLFEKNAVNYAVKYLKNRKIDFVFGTVFKHITKHGFYPDIAKYSFGFYTTHSMGFFIKKKIHSEIGYYNKKFLSADLDFFLRLIFLKRYKGCNTKSTELFGYFRPGGFSSKIKYRDHLKDLNQVRINNNQNRVFVYLLYLIKIIKSPRKFILNTH